MPQLLRKTEAGTSEHMQSAEYLAQSGDLQWFALLGEVAENNANNLSYLDDAAELGGDRMLPTLLSLLSSPDGNLTGITAVTAIGSTGSRAGVPILLDLLRNPDPDIANRARYGLRILTHGTANNDLGKTPQSQWSAWWAREGGSVPSTKPRNAAT